MATPSNIPFRLSFPPSAEAMHRGFDTLSAWLKQSGLPQPAVFRLRVIAEELMSNVVRHGHLPSCDACATVQIEIGEEVTMVVSAPGPAFDPIANRDKGYGLMITNGAADAIRYDYLNGHNITTVHIRL